MGNQQRAMPIKTAFTEMVGVEVPILQGGMHHVGFAEMAAAVSNAGGLGIVTSITITQANPDDPIGALRREIQKCRTMTDKPFGVNVTILPLLGKVDMDGIVRSIIEEGVKVVETAGRNPEKYVKMFKDAGVVVIHKCTSIRHALTAQRVGENVAMQWAISGPVRVQSSDHYLKHASAARQWSLNKVPISRSIHNHDCM